MAVTAAERAHYDPAAEAVEFGAVAFTTAYQRWRFYLEAERQRSPTTVSKYRQRLYEFGSFAGYLGAEPRPWDRPPKAVAREFGRFISRPNARTGGPLAPATKAQYLTAVGGFYRWASGPGGLVRVDPLAHFTPPRQGRALVARSIPWEDRGHNRGGMGRLLWVVEVQPRLEVMVWLAYRGGLRGSEIAGLRRERVWLGDGPVMRVLGKGAQWRDVDLDPELRDVLAGWLARLPGHSRPVVPHPSYLDRHITGKNVSDQLGRLLHRAEIRTTDDDQARPHDLRHTCLTELLEASNDPLAVQAFAGHAHFSTTQAYVIAAQRKTAEAVAKFPKRRRRHGSAA